MVAVAWKNQPDSHDFPAAAAYLALIAEPGDVDTLVKALKHASISHQKAKDILRAARLPLLASDNPHVAGDLAKVNQNQPLSPVLLVRGDITRGIPTQIADGYHRVCASYQTDEDTDIPCLLAPLHVT